MRSTTPLRLIIIIFTSVCGALIFRDFVTERIYVATASMEPAMPVGSSWWIDKFSFYLRAPRHGEVIVFQSPFTVQKDLIKRVIGLPGDTIEIRNKAVYRNNQKLDEPYVQFKRAEESLVGDNISSLGVPQGHVFVMGDNRDESGDSRDWKDPKTGERVYFLSMEHIKGRIIGMR